MERRRPPAEGTDMAHNAEATSHPEAQPRAHLRVVAQNEEPIPLVNDRGNRASIPDLSVDEAEERALESSRHSARILVELPGEGPTTYLRYLESHLQGRRPFLTIEEGKYLDVLYHVHENTYEAVCEVKSFGRAILRLLDLPESALMLATVKTMDDERMKRIMIAAGVLPPDLRSV